MNGVLLCAARRPFTKTITMITSWEYRWNMLGTSHVKMLTARVEYPEIGVFSKRQYPKSGFCTTQYPEIGIFRKMQYPEIGIFRETQYPEIGIFHETQYPKIGIFCKTQYPESGIFCKIQYPKIGIFHEIQYPKIGIIFDAAAFFAILAIWRDDIHAEEKTL